MDLDDDILEQSSQTEEAPVRESGEEHYIAKVDTRYGGLNRIRKGVIGLISRRKRIIHDDLGNPQVTNEPPHRYSELGS